MENGVFTDYGYDAPTGFLDSVTYPTSTSAYRLKLKYNYQNGLLSSVADFAVPSTVFWARNTTNAWGQVTQQTFGNGLITNRVFDAVSGTLKTLQTGTTPNPTLRQNLGYLWNKVGSLTQRQDNNQGLTESFYYDNLHRLDYSTLKVGAGTPTTNLDMAYDAMGNITLKSDRSASTYAYHATKKHQVTAVGTLAYTYDNNGNMATREAPANTITWSSANLPLVITHSGTTNTFSYGPNRDRWRLVYVNGSTTETAIYIGGLLEKWTRGTLTEWRHTIYAGDQPVALYTRQSGSASANLTRYFHLDHLGSIETITDSTNAVYVRERFTSYGQRGDPATWGLPIPSGDATLIGNLSRRGYTFHESLGGATLNHMNGRVQDPILGRFLSADPYIQDPGLTQAFNRYSYVYNNPLSYTDPSGYLASELPAWCWHQSWCRSAVLSVLGELFGGLFGHGKPEPPKGCFVINPVACTGVPGATRTPGFNPMLGLTPPSPQVNPSARVPSTRDVLFVPTDSSDLYAYLVFVTDEFGVIIAGPYAGSTQPNQKRTSCAPGNRCPWIADGRYPYTPSDAPGGLRRSPDEKKRRALLIASGGTVPTAVPNNSDSAKAQKRAGKKTMNEVFVHSGAKRSTASEGCLTIDPSVYGGFIENFPDGTSGDVEVIPRGAVRNRPPYSPIPNRERIDRACYVP